MITINQQWRKLDFFFFTLDGVSEEYVWNDIVEQRKK